MNSTAQSLVARCRDPARSAAQACPGRHRAAAMRMVPLTALLWSLSLPGLAQRDPTRPPAESARAAAGTGSAAPAVPLAVIVRDGRPYVVVGTRLYAQGERLGSAQIERIGESEIWLREGKTLHKIPRYSGVQRLPSP